MKVCVDKDMCIGCGVCESICPKVFRMDDEGKAEAADRELTKEEQAEAEDAMGQCPASAIYKK